MIDLNEKTVGLWFLPVTETQDWMCVLQEIEPDRGYKIVYRFRYYKDDEAFDSKDVKSWYEGSTLCTRAFAISAVRMVAQTMFEAGALREPYEILNHGDFKAFTKQILDAPFAFARMEGKPNDERI